MAFRFAKSSVTAALFVIIMLSVLIGVWMPTSSPPRDSRSKNISPPGENIGVAGVNGALPSSREEIGAGDSGVKNVVTKVYSAVALSIKTNKSDRRSASTGST
jgi:hypothetical protein